MLAGCASGPTMRMAGGSTQGEREVGQQQAKIVQTNIGLVDDPRLAGYLQQVGQRLAQQTQRQGLEYRFFVVDMAVPNAFALPGGYIYVSRGLLALVNSEDELAGVLGHEIAHVEARHAVKRSQAQLAISPLQIATGVTGIFASLISPELGAGIINAGQTAGQFLLAPYSRDQEREADRIGQELAARSGWKPQGLTSLLETLDREERSDGEQINPEGFLATHPSTPERIAATAQHAATLVVAPPDGTAKNRAETLAQLDGLLLGDNPSRGVLLGNRFLLPALGLRMTFPAGWEAGRAPGMVGAVAPGKAALLILRPAALGDDPLAVAQAMEKRSRIRLLENARQTRINDLPAVQNELRAKGKTETYWLSLTWVQLGKLVYLITGVSPESRVDAFGPPIRAAVATFGPLSEAEKGDIAALRLRLVTANEGETLEQLAARSGTVWDSNLIAIANALARDATFRGGEVIKVATPEPLYSRQSD